MALWPVDATGGFSRAPRPQAREERHGEAWGVGQDARRQPVAGYGGLPLHFEENRGQADPGVRFLARIGDATLFLTTAEAVLVLPLAVLRIRPVGADPQAVVSGLERLPGVVSYFRGSDPHTWHADIPTYARIRYTGVYPGVDMVYYGNQGCLEYDFVVAPGADPKAISLAFEGAQELSVDKKGDLVLRVNGRELRFRKPIAYQEVNGRRREVAARYVVPKQRASGSKSHGTGHTEAATRGMDPTPHFALHTSHFQVAAYDPRYPLVIDPQLVYATCLGGSDGNERAWGIAVDAAGCAYITGETQSSDFPALDPVQGRRPPDTDAFVAKLNAAGDRLLYATYLGGERTDSAQAIAVDASGCVFVTGHTESSDLPTVNPYQRYQGDLDAFVVKLSAEGNALLYATYLGGGNGEYAYDIAVDERGRAFVAGATHSGDFPTIGGHQAPGGGWDAFVTKLNARGSAAFYSIRLGGIGNDGAEGVALDAAGCAYLAGHTHSGDFPRVNPLQEPEFEGPKEGPDAFVAKLSASGLELLYSTHLGGSKGEHAHSIAVDAVGCAYVTGVTLSDDFPTVNAFQGNADGFDAFVAKLDASGRRLVYCTYLGGSHNDAGDDIAVDAGGCATVTGRTASSDFPAVGSVLGSKGKDDAFVARLDPSGSRLLYCTLLGGGDKDHGRSVALDAAGCVYIAGTTASMDFPGFTSVLGRRGHDDAFVVRLRPSAQ